MDKLSQLLLRARAAEARQERSLVTWKKWRKEARDRLVFGAPWDRVIQARRQRSACAAYWARARDKARKARSEYNRTW